MLDTVIKAVRIVIVDDHPVIRFGLKQLLNNEADMMVVGEAEHNDQLFDVVHETKPDVVVLDLELGDSNGATALKRLRETEPDIRVLIYTAHSDDTRIQQAADSGMDGYLLKDCPSGEIVTAIRSVHAGGTVLNPTVASRLMQHMNHKSNSSRSRQTTKPLSNREIEVLVCMAQGKSNRAIAKALYICEATVKFHVHAILGKLHASNRTEAVTIGVQKGLINLATQH